MQSLRAPQVPATLESQGHFGGCNSCNEGRSLIQHLLISSRGRCWLDPEGNAGVFLWSLLRGLVGIQFYLH